MPNRIDSFDNNTLGRMVQQNAAGELALSQPLSKMSSRMTVPQPLVDYLRKQFINDYHISPNLMKHFPDAKLVRFWLLQSVTNRDQRDDLINLLDNDYRVMHKVQHVLDTSDPTPVTNGSTGLTDTQAKQIRQASHDTQQIKAAMQKLYRNQTNLDEINMAGFMAATLAAMVTMGWSDVAPAPGDKQALAHVTSSDNFIRMTRLLREQTGLAEQHRVEHDKQSHRA